MRGRLNAICGDRMDEMDGMGGNWLSLDHWYYKSTCGTKKKRGSMDLVANCTLKNRRPDRIRLREMCFPKSKTELEDYIDIQLTKTFMGLDVLFKVQSDRLLHKVRLKLTIQKIILEVNVLLMKFIWL